MRAVLVLLTLLPLAATVQAAPRIEALALFSGRAMLVINGKSVVLQVGQTGPEGVALLAADSSSATVAWRGQRRRLTLSKRIASHFSEPDHARVEISRSDDDHYHVAGAIDGQAVRFLVDTGASVVAINSALARSLGLDWQGAPAVAVRTAGGYVRAWPVTLRRVEVGGIALSNVRAVVTAGLFPRDVLLGMSFLGEVSLHERDGVLSLER